MYCGRLCLAVDTTAVVDVAVQLPPLARRAAWAPKRKAPGTPAPGPTPGNITSVDHASHVKGSRCRIGRDELYRRQCFFSSSSADIQHLLQKRCSPPCRSRSTSWIADSSPLPRSWRFSAISTPRPGALGVDDHHRRIAVPAVITSSMISTGRSAARRPACRLRQWSPASLRLKQDSRAGAARRATAVVATRKPAARPGRTGRRSRFAIASA